jgi:hypothetical protein
VFIWLVTTLPVYTTYLCYEDMEAFFQYSNNNQATLQKNDSSFTRPKFMAARGDAPDNPRKVYRKVYRSITRTRHNSQATQGQSFLLFNHLWLTFFA